MAIDRKRLIAKHDPVYTHICTDAPLTVGNGALGFTADVTGMQTLDALYRQAARKDLPLYLPGNGSLLLALPLMAAGWQGGRTGFPGFPADGSWMAEAEGILPFPY